MREVYKAVRNLSRRPVKIADWEALALLLSEESGLTPTCCHASILALADMKLVELTEKPFRMQLLPMQKTDPQSSALWRAIQTLKKENDGRELE
jgi:hypothetical protein